MLQWGRASPDQCGQGGRSGHPVPGLGTSRLLGQGTWFGVQMGILVSQGPQGDCSRAPTEIHRLGSVVWHVGAPRIAPQMGDPMDWGLLSQQHLSVSPSPSSQVKPVKTVNNQNKTVLQTGFRLPS